MKPSSLRRFTPTLLSPAAVVAACAAVALLLPPPAAAGVPPEGLIAHWPIDGGYGDASGNGYHAENHGATLVADRFGHATSAVAVANYAYLSVPDAPGLSPTAGFTVALWFRLDAIQSAFSCLVGKDHTTAFAVGLDSGGSDQCPDPGASRRAVVHMGHRAVQFPGTSFDCGTGEWRHLAVTYDGTTRLVTLYLDGAVAGSTDHSGDLAPSTSPLGIGRDGRWNDFFVGRLDDVVLYDRALSAAEIGILYQGGAGSPSVENPGGNSWVVPASARADGLGGTVWVTDLVLHNPGDGPATANLFFLASRTDNRDAAPHRVAVPAGASVRLADVVASLFGRPGATGAILVGADRTLIVSSRTFNVSASGTYGQSIPGVPTTAAWDDIGHRPRLVQLAHSPAGDRGFRSNLGAVNLGPSPIALEVGLFSGAGQQLGTATLTLRPYGHAQLSNAFGPVAAGALDDAFAEVVGATAGARYLVYASVVDNRSGDPVFIPGR